MTDTYPVRRAAFLPPLASLQWNHSVLLESDFRAPWQALQDAFDLHQEVCPGDFDDPWIGELGLPPPKLRHRRPRRVAFNDQVLVAIGDGYEPIGTWDYIYVSSSSVASSPCTVGIAQWMQYSAEPQNLHGWLASRTVCPSTCKVAPTYSLDGCPATTCSIMDAFIQLARLPADEGGGPDQGGGGHQPGARAPDFTDNMLDRIDHDLFPASNIAALGFTIRTWFIHHETLMRNEEPRLVHLVGDRDSWTDQIRNVWQGFVDLDEPMAFTLPNPMPPRRPAEYFIALDVILSQGLQQPRYSGLVSVHHVDEGDGTNHRLLAASFGTHVSGFHILGAAGVQALCIPPTGSECNILFGAVTIPRDFHPGHRMRPGHSFMIQVPRDPQLDTGQPVAATATSSAVVAHGLPGGPTESFHEHGNPGDDPDPPEGDPPSTPSSWHPVARAGPMFNCHFYRLRHPPLHLFLRNAAGVPMLIELAQHIQVVPSSILHAHAVHVQMVGERPSDWSFIVQTVADLPAASSDALIVLDVEIHFHIMATAVQPLPASTRRVCRVPCLLTRETVLRYAGVAHYCHRQRDRCLVQFNNVGWPSHDHGPRRVQHGAYLRVLVPPPDEGGNTLQAIHVSEQSPASVAAPAQTPALNTGAPAPSPASSATPAPSNSFHPNFEPAPISGVWHSDLRDLFDDQAVLEHADEGPILYVQTWFINHETFVHCPSPRVVRLDQMDHLWLHDVYAPWRDLLQASAVTSLRLVHPRPPRSSTAIDAVHLLIEQHPREARAAGVVSAVFHGPHDDRLLQGAYSMQRWLCVEDLIDLLHINHICEVQRCTAFGGAAQFQQFVRHDVPSGISIEVHVRPVHCDEGVRSASSADPFVPRRTMPIAGQSLLQTSARTQSRRPALAPAAPALRQVLSLDALVQKPQFTFIDCQRPLFLREQLLQPFSIHPDLCWHHMWWHPATYEALHQLVPEGGRILGYTLYADGSAHAQSGRAAAGVVLLIHSTQGFRWGGFASTACLGAFTAPRAEATALMLALVWILQLQREHLSHDVWFEIVFGCHHTAYIAQGKQAANHNLDLHAVIRALVQWVEVRLQQPIYWTYVPGHCGHPWNEAADVVCRFAADNGIATTHLDIFYNLCTFDTRDPHPIRWLWLLERSLMHHVDAPELHGHWWRLNVSAPLAHPPDSSLHPATRRRRDVGEVAASASSTIRMATANVLTMFPDQKHASGFVGARAEDLERQFSAGGLHFVGLQETRMKMFGHTTLGCYHILSSPATARGQGGVQLWVRKTLPTSHGTICLGDQDLQILHSTSGFWYVAVTLDYGCFCLFSMPHAMTARRPFKAFGRPHRMPYLPNIVAGHCSF